jgi:hypothetical protein
MLVVQRRILVSVSLMLSNVWTSLQTLACLANRCVVCIACRRLHNAAKVGNTSAAEAAFTSMAAAGLPPGPRAYHVLLCSYLKAGDLPDALAATARATEAGEQQQPWQQQQRPWQQQQQQPIGIDDRCLVAKRWGGCSGAL